jgi:adenine phosphoribosyltransferase
MTGAQHVGDPAGSVASGDAGPEIAALVASRLRDVPGFPIPEIVFKDIVPLLADGKAFATCMSAMSAGIDDIELVAGVEARGFVLAGAIAAELGCGLVPIRKAGKLPPPTIVREYTLEYGSAAIEVPTDVIAGRRVLLVDDVLATGGTLRAAADLVEEAGGQIVHVAVLLELAFLEGRAALGDVAPLRSLLTV